MAVRDPDPVGPHLVAEAVEDRVRLGDVVRERLRGGIVPLLPLGRVAGRDDRGSRRGVAEPGSLHDLLPVDRVLERHPHLRVQQLPVLGLVRVGVEDEVTELKRRPHGDMEPRSLDRGQARVEAQRLRKPMFLWIMNGHPMGCT